MPLVVLMLLFVWMATATNLVLFCSITSDGGSAGTLLMAPELFCSITSDGGSAGPLLMAPELLELLLLPLLKAI